MTIDQQHKALAIWAGVADQYLLISCGMYWRPNNCGYTHSISKAGRFSKEHAESFMGPSYSGSVTMEPASLPDLTLDWLYQIEETFTDDQWNEYAMALWHTMLRKHDPKVTNTRRLVHASVEDKLQAMVKALNLPTPEPYHFTNEPRTTSAP